MARRSGSVIEVGVIETDDLAPRVFARGEQARELAGTLANQPGIGAIEEHRREARAGRLEERLGLMGLYGDHGLSDML